MKKRILPKTILELFFSLTYKAYQRSVQQSTVPPLVLTFFSYFFVVSSSLAFLPFHEEKFVFHIFTYIINFLSTKNNRNESIFEFIVYAVLMIIFIIITIVFSLFIDSPKKRSKIVYNFFVIHLSILAPLYLLVLGTEVGFHVLSLIDYEFSVVVLIKALIFEVFIGFLNFTLQYCVNNTATFSKGITSFFTAKMGTTYYSCLAFLRLLAPIRFTNNRSVFIAISVISCLLSASINSYLVYFNVFIIPEVSATISSVLTGSLWYLVISSITKIDDPTIVCMYLIGSVLGYYLSKFNLNIKLSQSLAAIDSILNNEKSMTEVYPKISEAFLGDIRNAFVLGVEGVLSPDFYEEVLSNYTVNEEFIVHCLKILAVYKSNTFYLEKVNAQFDYSNCSLTLKLFSKGVKNIIMIRKKKETKKCKKMIRFAEAAININKKHLIGYWKAVNECSIDEVFKLSSVCRKEEDLIEGVFENLIFNFENCPRIYKIYIRYLKNVSCDYAKQEHFQTILTRLETSESDDEDMIEYNAKEMLYHLPKRISKQEFQKDTLDIRSKLGTVSSAQISSSSISCSQSSEGILSTTEEKTEVAVNSTNIRETIKGIHFKKIYFMIFIVFLALFVPFSIGILALFSLSSDGFDSYGNLLLFESSFSSLLLSIPQNSYNILRDGLISNGAFLKNDQELELIGSYYQPSEAYKDILNDSIVVTSLVDNYVQSIPENNKHILNIGPLRRSAKCMMNIYHVEDNVLVKQVSELGYAPAINVLCESFLSYSSNNSKKNIDFSQEPWFLSAVTNDYSICEALSKFGEVLLKDIKVHVGTITSYSTILPIASTVVSVLFAIIGVIITYGILKDAVGIVKTLSKIPAIAIIKECNKLSSHCDDIDNDDKNRNKSSVLDTLSASQGISTFKIIVIVFILSIIFQIAEPWTFSIFISAKNNELDSLPSQKYYISLLSSKVFRQISLLRRIIAFNEGHGIDSDIDNITNKFFTNLGELSDIYNTLVYGSNGNDNCLINFNSETMKMFAYGNANPQISSPYELLTLSPAIQSLEIFMNNMRLYKDSLNDSTVMRNDNPMILTTIHYASDYLSKTFYNGEAATNETNDILRSVFVYSIYFVVGSLLINLFFMIIIISYQVIIMKNIKYALQTVSMLDPEIIQDNEAIESLISGNFNNSHTSDSIKQHFITSIQDNTDSLIFKVDINGQIISSNNAASKFFEDHKIGALSNFVDISSEIREVLSSSDSAKCIVDKEFTEEIDGEVVKYMYNVSVYKVPDVDYIIVIAQRDKKKEDYDVMIEKDTKRLNDIKRRINPHDVRDLFDNGQTIVDLEFVVIFSCKFANFTIEEDFEKTLEIMSQFNNANYEASKEVKDCSVVKKSGVIIFSLFNVRNSYETLKNAVDNAIQYAKILEKKCEEKGIKIAVSINSSRGIKLGRTSQGTVNFNIYGREVEENYRFVRGANEGEIKMSPIIYRRLESDLSSKAKIDEKLDDCYSLDLQYL